MTYCGPRSLPVSVFLGRTVAPGEPQWLPEDTECALEWQAEQARHCPGGCGTRPEVWFDDSGHLAVPPPFVVAEHRCPGCIALKRHNEDVQKDAEQFPQMLHGLTTHLEVNPEADTEALLR